jgi:hypothetical protein
MRPGTGRCGWGCLAEAAAGARCVHRRIVQMACGRMMFVCAVLRSEVLRLAACRLEPSGWRQAGNQAEFARPVTSEIAARLDFAFGEYDSPPRVNVTPYIAIVHEGIEAARKFITGRALYTLNEQIQTLMGDHRAHYRWSFIEPGMDGAADRLVSDCLEYAPSFYEQFRSLGDIARTLERMTLAKRSIMKESLALAYCLQGRLAEAEEALQDEINAARANPRDIANQQLPKYQELFGLQLDLRPH